MGAEASSSAQPIRAADKVGYIARGSHPRDVAAKLGLLVTHQVKGTEQEVKEEMSGKSASGDAEIDCTSSRLSGAGLAKATLKVQNDLDPFFRPYRATVSVPPRSSVYTVLLQSAADDPKFTFRAVYYGEFSSHLITCINNVTSSETDETFWRFENENGAMFDRGVDLIGVFDGDVIIFRFTHYKSDSPKPTIPRPFIPVPVPVPFGPGPAGPPLPLGLGPAGTPVPFGPGPAKPDGAVVSND